MPVCKVCKSEKPTRAMRMWGGIATETCQDCYDAKKGAKASGAVKPADAEQQPKPPAPRLAIAPTEIIVEASLGFAAKVDGDNLVISQANHSRENDDDNITLTRSEARKLFDLFGEWIVA